MTIKLLIKILEDVFVLILCVGVVHLCGCMCTMGMQCTKRPEEGV